jgi:hypothetical protein
MTKTKVGRATAWRGEVPLLWDEDGCPPHSDHRALQNTVGTEADPTLDNATPHVQIFPVFIEHPAGCIKSLKPLSTKGQKKVARYQ